MNSDSFNEHILATIKKVTQAQAVQRVDSLQSLWSGYGEILRLELSGGLYESVVVKHIRFPEPDQHHPRGWHSDFAHQRKLRSYRVEETFYQKFAQKCNDGSYVPQYVYSDVHDDAMLIVMEDLTRSYPICPDVITLPEVLTCVAWLAQFHARFLGETSEGLWPVGTYWHLETRPDEWQSMPESSLKSHAAKIDQALNEARFQTLVHGDAKLANFCFSEDRTHVAAVDFQYVGGGVGVKDLAYFLSSCLDEKACAEHEAHILNSYFKVLRGALTDWPEASLDQLEQEWRTLYPVAWADFHRFLAGWSPNHWKMNQYIHDQTELALAALPSILPQP